MTRDQRILLNRENLTNTDLEILYEVGELGQWRLHAKGGISEAFDGWSVHNFSFFHTDEDGMHTHLRGHLFTGQVNYISESRLLGERSISL